MVRNPAGWSASGSCCRRSGARSTGRRPTTCACSSPRSAQAGTRSRPATLLHHRTRHGLPVPRQRPSGCARLGRVVAVDNSAAHKHPTVACRRSWSRPGGADGVAVVLDAQLARLRTFGKSVAWSMVAGVLDEAMRLWPDPPDPLQELPAALGHAGARFPPCHPAAAPVAYRRWDGGQLRHPRHLCPARGPQPIAERPDHRQGAPRPAGWNGSSVCHL
jgi:hypothetical protein